MGNVRVNEEDVKAAVPNCTALAKYIPQCIRTANSLTNYVYIKDTRSLLTDDLLFEIEKYLAAHFYALRDPQYRSKGNMSASGSFQGQSGMGLKATDWGQQAIALDITGTLAAIDQGRQKASCTWLGKVPSEQIDYSERD